MKKILIAIISSVIFAMFSVAVYAEEVEGLSEKIDALMMENNVTQEQVEEMDKQYMEDFNYRFWNVYLEPTKILGKMHKDSDEEEYEYCLSRERPNYSYGILMTKVSDKYAKQYAENGLLEYLIDETQSYWATMRNDSRGVAKIFSKEGKMIVDTENITITQEMIDYLKEKKQLKNEILKNGEKE